MNTESTSLAAKKQKPEIIYVLCLYDAGMISPVFVITRGFPMVWIPVVVVELEVVDVVEVVEVVEVEVEVVDINYSPT